MYKSGIASPCVDPTAGLSAELRVAALKAGYASPVLTDEQKIALAQAAEVRHASTQDAPKVAP